MDLDALPEALGRILCEDNARKYQRLLQKADTETYGLDGSLQNRLLMHALQARRPWAVRLLVKRYPGLTQNLAADQLDKNLRDLAADADKVYVNLNDSVEAFLAKVNERADFYLSCAEPLLQRAPSGYRPGRSVIEHAFQIRDFAALVACHRLGAEMTGWQNHVFWNHYGSLERYTHALLPALGADYNATDARGDRPIHKAVDSRYFYHIVGVAEAGGDMTARDAKNRTPLDRWLDTHGDGPHIALQYLRERDRHRLADDARPRVRTRRVLTGRPL